MVSKDSKNDGQKEKVERGPSQLLSPKEVADAFASAPWHRFRVVAQLDHKALVENPAIQHLVGESARAGLRGIAEKVTQDIISNLSGIVEKAVADAVDEIPRHTAASLRDAFKDPVDHQPATIFQYLRPIAPSGVEEDSTASAPASPSDASEGQSTTASDQPPVGPAKTVDKEPEMPGAFEPSTEQEDHKPDFLESASNAHESGSAEEASAEGHATTQTEGSGQGDSQASPEDSKIKDTANDDSGDNHPVELPGDASASPSADDSQAATPEQDAISPIDEIIEPNGDENADSVVPGNVNGESKGPEEDESEKDNPSFEDAKSSLSEQPENPVSEGGGTSDSQTEQLPGEETEKPSADDESAAPGPNPVDSEVRDAPVEATKDTTSLEGGQEATQVEDQSKEDSNDEKSTEDGGGKKPQPAPPVPDEFVDHAGTGLVPDISTALWIHSPSASDSTDTPASQGDGSHGGLRVIRRVFHIRDNKTVDTGVLDLALTGVRRGPCTIYANKVAVGEWDPSFQSTEGGALQGRRFLCSLGKGDHKVVIAVSIPTGSESVDAASTKGLEGSGGDIEPQLILAAVFWRSSPFDGQTYKMKTDETWKTAIVGRDETGFTKAGFDATWETVFIVGKYGLQPWGRFDIGGETSELSASEEDTEELLDQKTAPESSETVNNP